MEKSHRQESAPMMFVAAVDCIGHSREGDLLLGYFVRYKERIYEAIRKSSMTKEGKQEWQEYFEQAAPRNTEKLFVEVRRMLRKPPALPLDHTTLANTKPLFVTSPPLFTESPLSFTDERKHEALRPRQGSSEGARDFIT